MDLGELRGRTDVPVIAADQRGFITFVNDRFHEVFGWEASDLVGMPLPTIIPARFQDAHHLGFSRFLATGRPTLLGSPLSLLIVTKAGAEIEAEHFILAERTDDGWEFAASIRPVG